MRKCIKCQTEMLETKRKIKPVLLNMGTNIINTKRSNRHSQCAEQRSCYNLNNIGIFTQTALQENKIQRGHHDIAAKSA